MKISKIFLSILLFASFVYSYAGIIRSDVSSEKYEQRGKEKQFDCVGHVYKDTVSAGSCVLIDSRHVLSAAHVFIDHDTRPDTMQMGDQTIVVYQPINERVTIANTVSILFNKQRVRVKRIIVHPDYFNKEDKESCDLAILELEEPVKAIPGAAISYSPNELKSTIVGVGFGLTGPGDKLEQIHPTLIKIAGENVIDSIGGNPYHGLPTLMFCDFDHPKREDCNRMGNAKPLEMEYILGAGDSGGGIFRNSKGKWELIGICHGTSTDINQLLISGYYGQIMASIRLSPFESWITSEIK